MWIELLGGRIGRGRITALELVVGDGEKGAPQRIEVGDGRRIRVDRRFAGGVLFLGAKRPALALCVPSGQVVRVGKRLEETARRRSRSWDRPSRYR